MNVLICRRALVFGCVLKELSVANRSDRLFYACGNLGPFGNFSMSRWPRVIFFFVQKSFLTKNYLLTAVLMLTTWGPLYT